MKKHLFIILTFISLSYIANAQSTITDSLRMKKDSTLRVTIHKDSLKIEKEFAEKARWDNLYKKFEYPLLKGGKNSGVMPVSNPTEIPDFNIDYKLLFEVTTNNPDSAMNKINFSLDEVARVLNLHYASGIPLKRLMPVIVVHAKALNALLNNEAYQKKFKMDNPNIKLINDLLKIGTKFIACGQALQFVNINREDLLPAIKVSLTAQTVVTSYQLKGYVWIPDK